MFNIQWSESIYVDAWIVEEMRFRHVSQVSQQIISDMFKPIGGEINLLKLSCAEEQIAVECYELVLNEIDVCEIGKWLEYAGVDRRNISAVPLKCFEICEELFDAVWDCCENSVLSDAETFHVCVAISFQVSSADSSEGCWVALVNYNSSTCVEE